MVISRNSFCYQGQLSDADRLAVLGYLQQKFYVGGSTNDLSFQWQFDSTNIAGATNAALTITNVQAVNAGTYTVIVTDPAGSITSSNAVLTVLFPATITSSPSSQSVPAGTTVAFSAAASGTAPSLISGCLTAQILPRRPTRHLP